MSTSVNSFAEYYTKFEKMQSWIVNDLTKATIKAQTNFLVAMGVFNYFEILGGFCLPDKSPSPRFNFVFEHLLPKPYKAVFDKLDQITNKNGAYDCLRCGMTHEYLVKTYASKEGLSSIDFIIYGVNDEAGFLINVSTKNCGLELLELEKGKYHLRVYNPRLIHDLNIAFEALKKKLIDNEPEYRVKFETRCEHIRLERLT